MNEDITPKKPNVIVEWIDYRLPIFSFLKHFSHYQTPKILAIYGI